MTVTIGFPFMLYLDLLQFLVKNCYLTQLSIEKATL